MANRSITVTLRANVQDFKSQFDAATKAAENAAKGVEGAAKQADTSMGRMVQSARDNREAWTTAGATLTGFGAAALGGLGLAAKAAMDWESSWAGVQKTVDGTAPQMAALEAGLRGLARELPSSHTEIAAVAEAAGQLGIATPNVLGFTRTMIDMGEATNLSAEEAATSLARFMNVMGTSQTDVGRLGASVVGLGNNFATTESEIVAMAQRLSGAGAQANLTEGDVLGIAAAMSSVGIEAEAGGSAMSMTMKRIGKAVDEGGASLDMFAQVSGMSAEQFTEAWRNDPATALDAFITGLSGVESQGMTTNGVLTELGITGIREADALLRLSAASGQGAEGMSLLAEAVAMGNEEFNKGSALIEEASKRYETAESRIAMAKNALVDAGISIGGVVLPALADLADGVADAAGWFADLPAPVHGAVGALAGIAGAGSLAAGSFLLIFPRVMDTVSAFRTLKQDMPGVASGLGKVGKAAGVAAASIAVLNIAGSVVESMRDGAEHAELFAAQLLNVSANGEITASTINDLASSTVPFGVSVQGVGDALSLIDTDPVSAGVEGLTKALLGVPTTVDVATESLSSLDGALSQLVSGGYLDEFSRSFAEAVKDAEAYGYTAEDLIENLPGLKEVLTPIATEMGLTADNATLAKIALEGIDPAALGAADGMTGLEGATEGTTGAVEEQVDALEELQNRLEGTANLLLGARGSELDYLDSVDAATEALKEHGKVLDENGNLLNEHDENARKSRRELDGIASATHAWADAQKEAGASAEELDGIMSRGRESFIEMAQDMGMSEEAAIRLADELQLLPDFVETEVRVETETALGKVSTVGDALLNVFDETYTADVDADTGEATERVWGFGDVLEQETADKTTTVTADVEPAIWEVNRFNAEVDAAGGTVTINGDALPADQALATIMGIINSSDGTVTIDGMSVPADQALGMIIGKINSSDGTVTIEGNNAPANAATDRAKRKADGTTGTIDVNANTGGAESSINSTARNRSSTITAKASTWSAENQLNWLARNRTSTITVRTSGAGGGVKAQLAYASGGAVYGPGTGTSDSIDAKLSNNEHVWTAREVGVAGGHQAIYSLRQQLLAGAKTLRLATGGGIEDGRRVPAPAMSVIRGAAPQAASAQVDTGAITSAVRSGMQGMTVALNLDGRTLYGAVVDAGKAQRRPFVTGRS